MNSTRAVLVGAFVVGGIVLFSIGLFMIGNRRMLFADNFDLRSEFAEIAGLQLGAKVRVAGMDAGEVREIHVPTGPRGKFQVIMRVRSDLHPVIRVDSVASIQNEGLVGNKFVQIEAGTDAAPLVAENGSIRGEEPIDLSDIIKKMIPMRRLGKPEELDGALLLLATDAGSWMTGSVIAVDGGHLVSAL